MCSLDVFPSFTGWKQLQIKFTIVQVSKANIVQDLCKWGGGFTRQTSWMKLNLSKNKKKAQQRSSTILSNSEYMSYCMLNMHSAHQSLLPLIQCEAEDPKLLMHEFPNSIWNKYDMKCENTWDGLERILIYTFKCPFYPQMTQHLDDDNDNITVLITKLKQSLKPLK